MLGALLVGWVVTSILFALLHSDHYDDTKRLTKRLDELTGKPNREKDRK